MGRIKIREVKMNDHEARIQQEIQERTTKGTNLRDLAILYNAPAPPSATDSKASLPAMKPKRRSKLFHQPSNDPWFTG